MMAIQRRWRDGLVLLLLLTAATGAVDLLGAQASRRRSKNAAEDEDTGELTRPQLLNADSNPTLRYPIASFSGWSIFSTSYGWLDVTRGGIRYTVVEPPKKTEEGFEAAMNEISELKMVSTYLVFKTSQKKRTIFYVPQSRWGSIHSGPGAMQVSSGGVRGTSSLQQAIKNFDRVLAMVKPPPPPGPEISLRAEPGTVEKGRSVTIVWSSVNAATLDLEPGGGKVASQGSVSLAPDDSTTYTLTATGPGGTKVATARVIVSQPAPAAPPTLVLVEPSVATSGQTLDVSNPSLTIRGVVMDSSGIPAVTINGSPAAMRPKGAQAAEFASDPITLQPGENRFEVNATNAARAEAKVIFIARFTPPPKPQPIVQSNTKALAKAEIVDLLRGDVSSARVADLVKERGIKFVPSEDDLKEIRVAGGGDDVVNAIKGAAASVKE